MAAKAARALGFLGMQFKFFLYLHLSNLKHLIFRYFSFSTWDLNFLKHLYAFDFPYKSTIQVALVKSWISNVKYLSPLTALTRSTITAIVDSAGTQHVEQTDIKGAATKHFKDLLTETKEEESYDDLLQHLHSKVTDDLNKNLTAEIKEEEIVVAIWSLQPNKAPGPDGFPICFYKDYWELIKKYLIKYLNWIQKKGKIGGYTNSTHLALIPKENCHPISLASGLYLYAIHHTKFSLKS